MGARIRLFEPGIVYTSIGRISSDSTATILRRDETRDWCLVITPGNREGWMICDALDL